MRCQSNCQKWPGILLATKAASGGRYLHPHPILRHAQHFSDITLLVMRLMRTSDDGDPSVFIDQPQQGFTLQCHMLEERRLERGFEGLIGGRKSRLEVSV